jgi:hypothetical protein
MGAQMHPDPDESAGNKTNEKDEKVSGKVYITYSGYEVNKGIPDSIFEEKKK